MRKVYVVTEDYTVAFYGVFSTWKKASAVAKEIGGMVIEYELGIDGEWHTENEE